MLPLRNKLLIRTSFSPAYDDNEGGDYDIAEPEDPFEEHNVVDDVNASQNPDQLLATGDNGMGVISSGDPSAKANRSHKDKAPKDKKIPNDQRTTTPYMTKYERARILGTRALQIRLVTSGYRGQWNGSHLVGRSISKSQPITQRQGAQGQEDTQRPADDDTIHDKVRESQNLGHSGIADQVGSSHY